MPHKFELWKKKQQEKKTIYNWSFHSKRATNNQLNSETETQNIVYGAYSRYFHQIKRKPHSPPEELKWWKVTNEWGKFRGTHRYYNRIYLFRRAQYISETKNFMYKSWMKNVHTSFRFTHEFCIIFFFAHAKQTVRRKKCVHSGQSPVGQNISRHSYPILSDILQYPLAAR